MMRDGSLEFGITPGREFPVFDLDFGRVGMQICWDVGFADGWQALADQDAELVLFATNPAVPLALRGYAWRHGYYIAASTVHPVAPVVDPIGRVVAATSTDREVVVVRVNLDYRVVHSNCMWDWSLDEHPEYAGQGEDRVGRGGARVPRQLPGSRPPRPAIPVDGRASHRAAEERPQRRAAARGAGRSADPPLTRGARVTGGRPTWTARTG